MSSNKDAQDGKDSKNAEDSNNANRRNDTNNTKEPNDNNTKDRNNTQTTNDNETNDINDTKATNDNDTKNRNYTEETKETQKTIDTNNIKDTKTNKMKAESTFSLASLREELDDFRTRESLGSSNYNQDPYPGVYRSEYDYATERHNPFATNLLEATSYLVKGCLGAGILSMHEGFMYGGILGSGVGAAVIGLLLGHCMTILVRSAQRMYLVIHVPRLTYPDLAEAAVATGPVKKLRKYSKNVRYFVELLLFLETSGTCSLYEIVIARTIKKVFEYLFAPVKEMQLTLRTYLFLIMIPLIVLCMIRKWKYLAPFSIVADLFVAICVITTMIYSMTVADSIHKRALWKSVPGLFRFFGICLYTMDGTPVVLPIENNMRSSHHAQFVVYSGMTIVFILSTSAGFLGYWGWGEHCRSPVTIHMPMEPIPIILQFLLVTMLAVTFAIQFWVPFKIIWHYIGRHRDDIAEKRHWLERFYRIVLLFFITCVSATFHKPNKLMIFFGVTFVCVNSLVFPSMIETMVFWQDHIPGKIRWFFVKNVIICVVSLTFCCGGLYSLYFT